MIDGRRRGRLLTPEAPGRELEAVYPADRFGPGVFITRRVLWLSTSIHIGGYALETNTQQVIAAVGRTRAEKRSIMVLRSRAWMGCGDVVLSYFPLYRLLISHGGGARTGRHACFRFSLLILVRAFR